MSSAQPEFAPLVLGTRHPAYRRALAIPARATRRHLHAIGLTGSGKSRFLDAYALQLIRQGVGVSVVDPHGDTCLEILSSLERTGFFEHPAARARVLYFDWGHPERYPAFNILDQPRPPHQVAQQFLQALKRVWAALEGGSAPMLENIVLASTLVLIHNRLPITQMERLLTDASYRAQLLTQVSDADVAAFFRHRFDRGGGGAAHTIESTLRRVFLLTFSPALKHSLGADSNRLPLRPFMDQGVSVLHNLSGLDEYSQRLLGSLLAVTYESAALSRADLAPTRRRPHHLILEEFSMFAAESEESLARALDLTRKHGLYLVLSHQTFSQLSGRMRGALQNATQLAFRLGYDDASLMAPYLTNYDPAMLKPDPLGLHPNGAYAGVGEQTRRTAARLRHLRPGEALVRLGRRTHSIRALYVPDPVISSNLRTIIDWYADTLQQAPNSVETDDTPAAPRLGREVPPVRVASRARARERIA